MRRLQKKINWLTLVLLAGLLAHSLIFLYINRTLDPLGDLSPQQWMLRQERRRLAEGIAAVCGGLYSLGHLCLIGIHLRKGSLPPVPEMLVYWLRQIGWMLVCTVPFALMDTIFWGDHLFPLWSLMGSVLFLFALGVAARLYQKRSCPG